MSYTDATYIDELIDFKNTAVRKLGNSQEVVGLILDKPDIDMESDEALAVVGRDILDHSYCDDTLVEVRALIFVEAAVIKNVTTQMRRDEIDVHIIVDRQYMPLDPAKFKGVRGNRRDNLARQVNQLLQESDDFGIGSLTLIDCEPFVVPKGYSGLILRYRTADFDT